MTKNQNNQKNKFVNVLAAPTVLSPRLALAAVGSKARTALTGVAVKKNDERLRIRSDKIQQFK